MNITMIVFLLAGLAILPVYLRVNDRTLTLSTFGRLFLGLLGASLGISLVPTLCHVTHMAAPVGVIRACGVMIMLTLAMVSESLGFGESNTDTVNKVASILLTPALILTTFC